MLTWLGSTAAALLMAILSTSPADALAGAPACRKGRLVRANASGEVRDFDGAFHVCMPNGRERATLGPSRDDSSSAHVVLAERVQLRGHFVAWVLTCYCDDTSAVDVYRLDLRGHHHREYAAPGLAADRFGVVLRLRLSRRGAVAWIANDYTPSVPRRELWVEDRAGTRRLGRAARIDRLRIRVGTARWRQDGRGRRYRLR